MRPTTFKLTELPQVNYKPASHLGPGETGMSASGITLLFRPMAKALSILSGIKDH